MDIIIHEEDLKQIVSDHLTAKGNRVSKVSIIFEQPETPGQPQMPMGMGPFGQMTQMFERNDPMRPKLGLKCNIETGA